MDTTSSENPLKEISIRLFNEGIKAVNPAYLISTHINFEDERITISDLNGKIKKINIGEYNNIYVIGAGKGSSSMAKKLEEILGENIIKGIVIAKYGFGEELKLIDQNEADHPLPDENGLAATQKIYSLCENASEKDLIIALISGGASALLVSPADGIALQDKIEATNLLLLSGATISEVNVVRKHLSKVKGGKLLQTAFPATVISLVVSDVIGDDLSTIGSGPFYPDDSTFSDALEIIKKYSLFDKVPSSVLQYLIEGKNNPKHETPSSENKIFSASESFLIGNNILCLKQIKEKAQELKFDTKIVNSQLSGVARNVGANIVLEAVEFLEHGAEEGKKYCLLYGGETTVDVTGDGKGGRNQELALAGSIQLSEKKGVSLLSCGTDGNDGPTDAAGAFCDWNTIQRGNILEIDLQNYLNENNAYNYFNKLGDLVITGPTKTNVMDIQIVLIDTNIK